MGNNPRDLPHCLPHSGLNLTLSNGAKLQEIADTAKHQCWVTSVPVAEMCVETKRAIPVHEPWIAGTGREARPRPCAADRLQGAATSGASHIDLYPYLAELLADASQVVLDYLSEDLAEYERTGYASATIGRLLERARCLADSDRIARNFAA